MWMFPGNFQVFRLQRKVLLLRHIFQLIKEARQTKTNKRNLLLFRQKWDPDQLTDFFATVIYFFLRFWLMRRAHGRQSHVQQILRPRFNTLWLQNLPCVLKSFFFVLHHILYTIEWTQNRWETLQYLFCKVDLKYCTENSILKNLFRDCRSKVWCHCYVFS